MDRDLYRKIVLALEEGDRELFGEYLAVYIPIAEAFLMYTYRIDKQEAYDVTMAVIESLLTNFDTIKGKEHENFSSYLLMSLRNEFLYGLRKKKNSQSTENEFNEIHQDFGSEQLYDSIRRKEDFKLLKKCLDRLSAENFRFIRWIMRNPRANSKQLEQRFGLSPNTIYQRKHRLVNRLSECIKQQEKKF